MWCQKLKFLSLSKEMWAPPQQMCDILSHLLISLSDWLIGPLLLYRKHSRATAPTVAMGTRTYLPQQCCCLLSYRLLLIPFLSSIVIFLLLFPFFYCWVLLQYISTCFPVCLPGDYNDCDQKVPPASPGCCSDPQRWALPHSTLPPHGAETRGCSPRTKGRPQSLCEMSATSTDLANQLKLLILGRIWFC